MRNKKHKTVTYSLFSIRRYVIFFISLCFVITCCMLLFLDDLDIGLHENRWRAISTFINIFFLSFIFTILDGFFHKISVVRPVRQILEASQNIIKGDFTARIESSHGLQIRNEMDLIIDNFNEMAEELASIETLRSDFIANVSHELKTPLSIIKNYADMMQNDDLSMEEQKEYARIISDTSQDLSALIMNILKLNKLENQKIYLEAKEYNVSNQLIECLVAFEHIWEEKNITIETAINDDLMLYADEELMSIVWNNLLSNAFKFTDAKGTVGIRAFEEDGYIIVSVHDTGNGIHPDVGKHIFEKFYQGDISHSTKGNGLGLALVKKIVEIMKADIYVESIPNKSTVFTVKLRKSPSNANKL